MTFRRGQRVRFYPAGRPESAENANVIGSSAKGMRITVEIPLRPVTRMFACFRKHHNPKREGLWWDARDGRTYVVESTDIYS